MAKYAGFWIRLAAYIIDPIILTLIGFILGLVSPDVASVLNIIIPIVYIIGFWTWRGQTPGKIVLRIRIIRTDGSPIGLGRAILRYIGYFVSAIILLIGFLWIAFDSWKQGIHDKIADTYVIKLPR